MWIRVNEAEKLRVCNEKVKEYSGERKSYFLLVLLAGVIYGKYYFSRFYNA